MSTICSIFLNRANSAINYEVFDVSCFVFRLT
jgi:hypothetical protein